jgi:hypothetical protein
VIAIDEIRLDERALRSDWTIQALVAITLVIAAIGVGWLVAAGATDDHVQHLPVVRVQNQTHLPLQLTVVDRDGARLTLGTHQPGPSSNLDVVDMGPTWTFVASYGGREVFRRTVPRSEVTSRGWSLVIPTGTAAAVERQGFR